jgi:flagellar motor switch protein FliN
MTDETPITELPALTDPALPEPAPTAPALVEMPAGEVALPSFEQAVAPTSSESDLELVLDVPVELSVEIGRTTMTIRETLDIGPGSIVPLNKMTGEPVDLFVNGRRIARGEVVAIDEEFGLRVTQVVTPGERIDAVA